LREWKVESGEWRVESGELRVESGELNKYKSLFKSLKSSGLYRSILTVLILLSVTTAFTFTPLYSACSNVRAEAFNGDVFASPYEEECSLALNRLNVLLGYEDGSFRPRNTLTRAEFAAFVVRLMAIENTYSSFHCPFTDISDKDWFYKVVCISYDKNYIGDYPDNTFKPDERITYAEAVSILVRLSGHGRELSGSWPDNYLNKAAEINLTFNIRLSADVSILRGDCFILLCDALMIEVKR